MRIGVDYTAACRQQAGIGRSVRELVRAMVGLGGEWRLFVAGGRRGLPPPPGGATLCPSPWSERNHQRLWHRLRVPIPVEHWTGTLDLFHGPDFSLPPTSPDVTTLVTVHDLAYEHYPDETMPGMLGYLKRVVPRSVREADHVITPSAATQADLIALYDIPRHKITVINHGVEERFNPQPDSRDEALRARLNLPEGPFILTVGTMQPRKNHLRLVQALAQMSHAAPLVIAGGKGWGYEAVHEAVRRLGLTERVTFTGFVADEDLPALYRAAHVFAYPALYEGFGLPMLEAMACGTPVVAAQASALPEVLGGEGLLCDPHDPASIAAQLDRLLRDQTLHADLTQRGIERAARFTWLGAAQHTWDLYQRVTATHRGM